MSPALLTALRLLKWGIPAVVVLGLGLLVLSGGVGAVRLLVVALLGVLSRMFWFAVALVVGGGLAMCCSQRRFQLTPYGFRVVVRFIISLTLTGLLHIIFLACGWQALSNLLFSVRTIVVGIFGILLYIALGNAEYRLLGFDPGRFMGVVVTVWALLYFDVVHKRIVAEHEARLLRGDLAAAWCNSRWQIEMTPVLCGIPGS